MQLLTTVMAKLFNSICASDMDMCSTGSQEFHYYSGYGWEEGIMYQSIIRAKLYEEEI